MPVITTCCVPHPSQSQTTPDIYNQSMMLPVSDGWIMQAINELNPCSLHILNKSMILMSTVTVPLLCRVESGHSFELYVFVVQMLMKNKRPKEMLLTGWWKVWSQPTCRLRRDLLTVPERSREAFKVLIV
jgi:hypothetical protein